jgi:4-nitrophenyl phosphatase
MEFQANRAAEEGQRLVLERIARAQGYVFDLDGCLVLGDRLQAAAAAVWCGAEFLVTSYVPAIAGQPGPIASFSAAVAAGLAHVTGAAPAVMGKPSQLVLDCVRSRLCDAVADIVVVRDDPALDIALGRPAGVPTVLVLTGVARADSLRSLPRSDRPDVVVGDLGELLSPLRGGEWG